MRTGPLQFECARRAAAASRCDIGSRSATLSARSRLSKPLFRSFYHDYFAWLKKIGLHGAIIIHGLEESRGRDDGSSLTCADSCDSTR